MLFRFKHVDVVMAVMRNSFDCNVVFFLHLVESVHLIELAAAAARGLVSVQIPLQPLQLPGDVQLQLHVVFLCA